MRALALSVLLLGCNQAFDLAPTTLQPAADATAGPDAPDQDQDGVPNSEDNCPAVANPGQGDADADTHGDVCDNCPLIANPGQEHGGDSDAIGDLCDPHPTLNGDCLILVDTFTDPTTFAAHWLVRPATPAPVLTPSTTGLMIDPPNTKRTQLVPLTDGGTPFHGIYDGVLLATTSQTTGSELGIAATTSATFTEMYSCEVRSGTDVYSDMPSFGVSTGLSADHISPNLTVRVTLRDLAVAMPLRSCRVDYGIAVGTLDDSDRLAATGEPAILAQGDPATILGVAFYQRATTCPTPIFR